MKKFTLALLMFTMPIFATIGENYKIIRISTESLQQAVEKEESDAQYRCIQKWATIAAAAASVFAVMQLQGYFISTGIPLAGDQSTKTDLAHNIIPKTWENIPYRAGMSMVTNAIDCARSLSGAVSGFIGMTALSYGVGQAGTYGTYFHETEELSGFMKHQTKVWKLLHVMKEFAVPFDIYSHRLSMDVNFGAQRIMLSDFMKEMIDAAETSNEWSKNKLLHLMKKDFLYKASELQELQNYALHAMNYQQRIESGLVHSSLEIEEFNRVSIAEFCNLLILEVERVTAFIEMKTKNSFMKNYFSQGVTSLVDTTNSFAAQVEAKLALSIHELHEQSKCGNGLFDLVYDFNSFLVDHVEAMGMRLQYHIS